MASPAKALNCGDLADYYREFAKSGDDTSKVSSASAVFLAYGWGYADGDAGRNYAIPPGVDAVQVAHVVGKFIRDNPQLWHLPMGSCVHHALIATWPKK